MGTSPCLALTERNSRLVWDMERDDTWVSRYPVSTVDLATVVSCMMAHPSGHLVAASELITRYNPNLLLDALYREHTERLSSDRSTVLFRFAVREEFKHHTYSRGHLSFLKFIFGYLSK